MRTGKGVKCGPNFADPVRILPLHTGFGKVRSPHFTPGFDNTKYMEISSVRTKEIIIKKPHWNVFGKDSVAGLENGFEKNLAF